MRGMHRFLSKVPFDLYELALFHLVVKHGSFTKAAEIAGLTQSAITRQIQGIENQLGVPLLERTTRSVRLTPAGEFLYRESIRLLGDVDHSLHHLAQEFAGARKEIRVAVSRSIGLAYLPGFFHANLRALPNVAYRLACQTSSEIISDIEANDQDLGVFCPPARLPKTIRATHTFADAFTLIAPAQFAAELQQIRPRARAEAVKKQNWLVIDERTNTGAQLRAWMRREHWKVEPVMHLDNFDLIINLVALGMGVSFVPIRALALYHQRKKIVRIPTPTRFTRQLIVAVRNRRQLPSHVEQYIDKILF
jgi:DNA-binding transcriptional LysR family regulator